MKPRYWPCLTKLGATLLAGGATVAAGSASASEPALIGKFADSVCSEEFAALNEVSPETNPEAVIARNGGLKPDIPVERGVRSVVFAGHMNVFVSLISARDGDVSFKPDVSDGEVKALGAWTALGACLADIYGYETGDVEYDRSGKIGYEDIVRFSKDLLASRTVGGMN